MPIILVAAGLGVFAYLAGDIRFAAYLHIPYVKYTSEPVIICAAMIGAGHGILVVQRTSGSGIYGGCRCAFNRVRCQVQLQ